MTDTTKTSLQTIADRITWQRDYLRRELDNFRESFERNPARALSWSADTFRCAAQDEVLRTLEGWITVARSEGVADDAIVAGLREGARREVDRRVLEISGTSTDQAGRLMDDCLRLAWAQTIMGLGPLLGE